MICAINFSFPGPNLSNFKLIFDIDCDRLTRQNEVVGRNVWPESLSHIYCTIQDHLSGFLVKQLKWLYRFLDIKSNDFPRITAEHISDCFIYYTGCARSGKTCSLNGLLINIS